MPFEVQLGISKKLKHVPLRLSINLNHLQNWNIAYNDSTYLTNTNNQLSSEQKAERNKTSIVGEALRHITLGAEIMPSKSVNLRFGFNFKRRSELALADRSGLVGFSWGLGFRIKKFHISYGSARYHLAGSSNHFTITTNISEYYKNSGVAHVAKPKKVKVPKEQKEKKEKKNKKKKQEE